MNYYNDNDKFAAQWLRNLIGAGLIPNGEVDERSISDVRPEDLSRFTQCHFFAGIGGWSYALQLAGWPADRPVWTGSCPCQPFSVAGKGKGAADARHLWPEFYRLIGQCRPPVVFGEQVASKAGRLWLAGVRADLEALGYGVGAADISAASIGAPHIRQRLFWVAESELARRQTTGAGPKFNTRDESEPRCSFVSVGLADTKGIRRGEGRAHTGGSCRGSSQEQGAERECCSSDGNGLADTEREGRRPNEQKREAQGAERMGIANGPRPQQGSEPAEATRYWYPTEPAGCWSDAITIQCADGKARRIPLEPALFPLADGIPGRVGLLKGAGNSIVPQVAAEFITAYLECMP